MLEESQNRMRGGWNRLAMANDNKEALAFPAA
jgi:hypothetical protein